MKHVPIHEANEVINVNDARQSWKVENTFICDNGDRAVILVNNDREAFHQKQCADETELENKGYRGYR